MKIPFICIILLISITIQAQDDSLLSTSYKNKSLQTLQLFFENWVSDTKPLTEGQFLGLSDTVKNVYEIFQAFYNPKDISKEGGSEFGNNIYKDSKYLILQDKIDFIIVDSLTSL
ncbi:MAG TPA: hypothetical protein VFV08_11570, partial [Puia sp.]|nr:hypothetical protein [Puia sp.]